MKKGYPLIFIVEDNTSYNKILDHHLKQNNYANVRNFVSGEDCLRNLHLKPDIIIQDYMLQGISGINVLQRTKKLLPGTEFIFLSSQDNVDIAVSSIKSGAFDYIVKNDSALPRLLQKIDNIITLQVLRRKNRIQKMFIYAFLLITFLFMLWALWFTKHGN